MRGIILVAALLAAGCSSNTPAAVTQQPVVEQQTTPEPTLDLGVEGLGVITFGTDYDEETLLIAKPKTEFKKSVKNIAWSAQFSEPAGATTLKVVLAKVSKGGDESIIDSADVEISSPDFSLIANKGGPREHRRQQGRHVCAALPPRRDGARRGPVQARQVI